MANAQLNQVLRYLRSLGDTQSLAEASDGQLLERFTSRREEPAFGALLRRHGPMVLSVSQRVLHRLQDAEDVFQATFLLLARKATSIRKRESVSSWLHGVAHRLALRAKEQRARRQDHERRAANMRTAHSPPTWPEVQMALDTALEQLPEKYRAALVLCYLEGKSHAETAQILGCPLATVRTRVARGPSLLRNRLTSQGLTLSTAGLVALLLASAAPAAAPAALVRATLKAALPFATGQTAATLCSAPVAGLVEGGLKAMFLSKVKSAMAVLLAVSVLAGAGLVAHRRLAADDNTKSQSIKENAKPQAGAREDASPKGANSKAVLTKDDLAGAVEFSGCVLDPDGNPVARAKVYVARYDREQTAGPKVRAVTNRDGRFRFSVPKGEAGQTFGVPFAIADGYGLALPTPPGKTDDLTLRLVKDDVLVRGRILDLEGRPVAGVTIKVHALKAPPDGTLTPWLEALNTRKTADGLRLEQEYLPMFGPADLCRLFPVITTGADGRFEIKGVGRERAVALIIEGPTIETKEINVLTRPNVGTITVPWYRQAPQLGDLTYYAARFDYVAGPCRPVTGVVTDKGSGKPVAGAVVRTDGSVGNPIYYLQTTTDGEGRYRLSGLPRDRSIQGLDTLVVLPPEDQPYLAVRKQIGDKPGTDPASLDFELAKGVWIEGRVADKETGKGVEARLGYYVFADGREAELRELFMPYLAGDSLRTDKQGRFRIVGVSGRALLGARPDGAELNRYRVGVGADKIEGSEKFPGEGLRGIMFRTLPHYANASDHDVLAEVNPAKGTEKVKCELLLERGRSLAVRLLGPGGKPLEGGWVSGQYGREYWDHEPLKGAEVKVYGLAPGQGRTLLFQHAGKNLVGRLQLKGDEHGPVEVKLEPGAEVTGRLADANDRALSLAEITVYYEREGEKGVLYLAQPREVQTDAEGRFRIVGLMPGLKYQAGVRLKGQQYPANVFRDLSLATGEVKDLGNVKPRPADE